MLTINASIGYSKKILQTNRQFQSNHIYGITGANGCGKSTLLLTLAGEILPLEGSVKLDDVDVSSLDSIGKIRHIGTPIFYPDMSIGEHLRLLDRAAGLDFDAAVSEWHLSDLLKTSPSRVSSGQQQRFYLASQLSCKNPRVLLLDEPERHLDRDWIDKLCSTLNAKSDMGVTIVLASHSQKILELCDTIIQLP